MDQNQYYDNGIPIQPGEQYYQDGMEHDEYRQEYGEEEQVMEMSAEDEARMLIQQIEQEFMESR